MRTFTVTDDDDVMISATLAHELGSYCAIFAHFAAAEFAVPVFLLTREAG